METVKKKYSEEICSSKIICKSLCNCRTLFKFTWLVLLRQSDSLRPNGVMPYVREGRIVIATDYKRQIHYVQLVIKESKSYNILGPSSNLSVAIATRWRIEAELQSTSLEVHMSHSSGPRIHPWLTYLRTKVRCIKKWRWLSNRSMIKWQRLRSRFM